MKTLLLIVLLATAVAMHGCATPERTPLVVQCTTPVAPDRAGPALVGQPYGLTMTPLPLNSVQFGSTDSARSLAVQALYAERTATGTVVINARLVSCLDSASSVRLRTSFMRENTSPAEQASAWKTVWLEPRATAVYTEFSTSTDAVSYLIEIAK